ncbi:SDR family oxidoreductase [Pseudoxanthomonas indica]|uniref:NAD(P)H dehydrogenase (Quinone) n=1 Tax=Pseudoxanthomonas indica TaxID=428993 RepID=A0A1T5LQH1_9GAMM|nr:SDR family oxidoreductase [Pseudoxanthomonas indica]GGD38204.1 NAD(P)-dependent oxidoreductase [Pseudoxanthomonas indica]SKC78247.1 NAD(P)H dehydrogenase (quinone) [Pseudoxanthomonas indica]
MSTFTGKILVTGASGQLGALVIAALLNEVPPAQLIATARNPAKLTDLAARGVDVRQADYTKPASLDAAFQGADRLLLVSSSEVGQRLPQHRNVIEAAQRAGVKLLAYTSILRADSTPLLLGQEHRQTEALLRDSGIPFVFLRNGWYSENYTAALVGVIEHGAVLGSAGEGRLSTAGRADYADAAAVVLASSEDPAGRIYELAGDESFTLAEYAAEVARQAHKPVAYQDLPEADYKAALLQLGLPAPLAGILAQSDAAAAQGGLFDDGRQLSQLIGRATTPIKQSIAETLARLA